MPDDTFLIPKGGRRPVYPVVPPRPKLTRAQVIILVMRQSGKCGCGCGEALTPADCIDEHLLAREAGGSDDLSNRALFNKPCAKKKTPKDHALIAKGKRIRAETGQLKRQREKGAILRSRNDLPGKGEGAKLQGRSFDRTKTRGFNGKVRERVT